MAIVRVDLLATSALGLDQIARNVQETEHFNDEED